MTHSLKQMLFCCHINITRWGLTFFRSFSFSSFSAELSEHLRFWVSTWQPAKWWRFKTFYQRILFLVDATNKLLFYNVKKLTTTEREKKIRQRWKKREHGRLQPTDTWLFIVFLSMKFNIINYDWNMDAVFGGGKELRRIILCQNIVT